MERRPVQLWCDEFPVLSQTFVAAEARALTALGHRVEIVSVAGFGTAAATPALARVAARHPAGVAGDRLDPSAVRRRYLAARDAAALPPLRFHDLRHTAGTLLTRVLDPVTVRDVLGHADLKTTERYLHAVRASRLAEAATRAFTPG